ncbi:tumor necrosis factor receptor superfamily member 6-like [Narcine bancroftii]|uniref:tumor necrosis factor receptor superfamily member 6-like n=1 Tax=Narcine bancroftii TaxID=1343680 RepID=UPI00383101FF
MTVTTTNPHQPARQAQVAERGGDWTGACEGAARLLLAGVIFQRLEATGLFHFRLSDLTATSRGALECRPLRTMRAAAVGVQLLLALQNVKGADLSTSLTWSHQGFRRFKRQGQCGPDQYRSEVSTQCCDKCPAGFYLKKSCSNTSESSCDPCESNSYTDAKNALNSCLRCKACQEGNGQTIESKCTANQNARCRCMEHYFCETEQCKKCLQCKVCKEETEEIAHPCTATSDTVCKEKKSKQSLIALVILPIVALVIFGILYWKRKSLPCKRKLKSNNYKEEIRLMEIKTSRPEEPVVPDIELSEKMLESIVKEIEPKNYHQLGLQLGLTEPKLQEIEADFHNAKNRQGYYILYSWLQNEGIKGAFPKLIRVLRKAGYVAAAENILKNLNTTNELPNP